MAVMARVPAIQMGLSTQYITATTAAPAQCRVMGDFSGYFMSVKAFSPGTSGLSLNAQVRASALASRELVATDAR